MSEPPFSRRDLIRWSAIGAGVAPLAVWLSGCDAVSDRTKAQPRPRESVAGVPTPQADAAVTPSSTSPSSTESTGVYEQLDSVAATAAPSTSPATAPPVSAFDSTRPWWMQGDFAPVRNEVEAADLAVLGAIPPELNGLYVRNGSNPSHGDSPHWFFGDGMVHGVRLAGGSATSYRNRYVRTSMFLSGAGFGQGAPGGASNQSNISCLWHAGRLLTSGEVGLPYELDPDDLSTRGVYDFGANLTTAFTAHPKIDPATGRLHFFGYGFTPPYLTYHIAEANGTLVHSEVVDIPRSTMIHDFAITDSDAIFWDLPVVFDLDAAVRYISDPSNGTFPYRWSPDAGARIGVMPLAGGATSIRWFDIDPCYVFHGVNAFRRDGNVVIDVCRLSSMFSPKEVFGGELSLRRWTLDMHRGTVGDAVVADRDPGELPNRDPRLVGRPYRYGYFVGTRTNEHTVDFSGLIKHDYATGVRQTWTPPAHQHAGEWLFVPAGKDEDAGYLLTYLYDDADDVSQLVIVDATAVGNGPVARITLPQRVPYGFHATWVPTT